MTQCENPETIRACLTVLDQGKTIHLGHEIKLVHSTAGIVPAGSGTRYSNAFFAVWIYTGSQRCGNQYKDLATARARFLELTQPQRPTDLTPEGEQYVIPGTERDTFANPAKQGALW